MWRFLDNFFVNMSGRQRLFALLFPFSLLAVVFVLSTRGQLDALLVTLAVVVILLITRRIWLPDAYGQAMVRRVSLGVVLAISLSFSWWNQLVESVIVPAIFQQTQRHLPNLPEYHPPSETVSYAILAFVLLGIFFINYFMRDTTAMGTHLTPIDLEFPKMTYKQKLQSICRLLAKDLDTIDMETSWSEEYFTPLDAEVEMQSGNNQLKKITDLLTAIKTDRASEVFLVLGDPGAGKSVALRKLCRDLLKEVDKTGKIPLYINLREWQVIDPWTEEHPPTVQQLYDFVLNNLKERGDVFFYEFLQNYFKQMFDYGRLFIVLDSFDEIPAVLDADSSSWLIDTLSDVIYRFLSGTNKSRGILASRFFKKPTHRFQAQTVLEVRPFTELKIKETFEKKLFVNSEKAITQLFKTRSDLIPIARNPFTIGLIINYVSIHNNQLPRTQAELYTDYINRRLQMCQDKFRKYGLSIKTEIHCMEEVADLMFTTPEYGLEIPIKALKERLRDYPIEKIISIITYGRLGRLGGGEENRFSFAHRRFQEYFIARKLLNSPEKIFPEAIPTDSRWRDALVLYCEIAENEDAQKIANFCWEELRKSSNNFAIRNSQNLRAIHCLRFLNDAFKSRLDCIASFHPDLANFVKRQIKSDNLLSVKLAIESAGLLNKMQLTQAITAAFKLENSWISETALKACRHLSYLGFTLERNLKNYIHSLNSRELLSRQKELIFSLSLSDSFKLLRKFCKAQVLDTYSTRLGIFFMLIPAFLIHPIVLFTLILFKSIFDILQIKVIVEILKAKFSSLMGKIGRIKAIRTFNIGAIRSKTPTDLSKSKVKKLNIFWRVGFTSDYRFIGIISSFLLLVTFWSEEFYTQSLQMGLCPIGQLIEKGQFDRSLYYAVSLTFLGMILLFPWFTSATIFKVWFIEQAKSSFTALITWLTRQIKFLFTEFTFIGSTNWLIRKARSFLRKIREEDRLTIQVNPSLHKIRRKNRLAKKLNLSLKSLLKQFLTFIWAISRIILLLVLIVYFIYFIITWRVTEGTVKIAASWLGSVFIQSLVFVRWSIYFLVTRSIIILLLFLLVFGIFLLVSIGIDFFKEQKTIKLLNNNSTLSREKISAQFTQLISSKNRLKYIRLLKTQNITVTGNWPNGKLPNIDNDEASTLLAQLEERWLGLDR